MEAVVEPPADQRYVPPPVAVSVALLPEQMVTGAEAVATGGELIVTVAVLAAVALVASVMVTE